MSAHTLSREAEALFATTVRDGVARAIAVVGLGGVALIHLLDAPGTFQDQGYKGWLSVGLPGGADDIGNWGEPLGIASLFVEGSLAMLAATVLAARTAPAPIVRPLQAVTR